MESYDYTPIDPTSHGLVGLLLERVEEDIGFLTPIYRRIGCYNGLRSGVNMEEVERRTITIV